MRKYDSIKQIDLIDHQSTTQAEQRHPQSCTQTSSRFSHKNIYMSMQKNDNHNLECLTDRSGTDKINQFSIGQSFDITQTNSISTCVKSNIRTYIRFKPFTKQEVMDQNCQAAQSGIDIINNNKVVVQQGSCFSFDRVFQPNTSQKTLYEVSAKQIIKQFINGYNGTIFAYGQTGSGKTYTMFGSDQNENSGIIPQSIQHLFGWIESQKLSLNKVSLSCSMYQIYKQIICDLMTERPKQIKIKESANGNIQIQNLTIKQVNRKEQLLEWVNKGCQIRKTRQTDSNQRSSRSHLILTLYLVAKINDFQSKMSKLNLVDLAGSEKVSKTRVTGQGLQEAKKINLSLSCLGNAIYALSRGQQHIPFRDSKLTRVLQQSLSGNSITRVIVTCSMLPSCKQQTISSLKFANRIKNIKTSGSINLKKMNDQGVNKFMYQTLKASYQNCEQKLQKIKTLLDGNINFSSKQDIVDFLKVIINEGKYNSENQFLNMESQPFQTFRSPSKDQTPNQSSQHTIIEINENNQSNTNNQNEIQNKKSSMRQLIEHIKNLQSIIIKQQQIIETQGAQIQILSKEKTDKSAKTENVDMQQKRIQKIKILKTNANISNVGYKLKNQKPDLIQCSKMQSKQKITSKTKYDDSNKKMKEQNEIPVESARVSQKKCLNVGSHQQQKKQKLSYQNMQKQILAKQIRALGQQNKHLKKIISKSGNQQQLKFFTQFQNNLNTQIQCEPEALILMKKLQQKDAYIAELQKILSISNTLPNSSAQPSKKNSISFKNSLDIRLHSNRKRNIQLFVSPTASSTNTLNRISSAKRLFRI